MKGGNIIAERRMPAASQGYGVVRFHHVFGAVVENAPLLLARLPSTPLRVLAIAAISASLRSRGLVLTSERRQALIQMMELGALLNNRFDGDPYRAGEIRKILRWFRHSSFRSQTTDYLSQLRKAEMKRPTFDADLDLIRNYREQVNQLSLTTLWSIATGIDPTAAMRQVECQRDLNVHFRTIMLVQVIDDIIDRGHDLRRGLPSFANAVDSDGGTLRRLIQGYDNHEARGCVPQGMALVAVKWLALLVTCFAAARK